MLVPLVVGDGHDREWCIVELQGVLETKRDQFAGLDIGTMAFGRVRLTTCATRLVVTVGSHTVQGGTVTLRVGTHCLEGKAQPLPKPLAVVARDPECGEAPPSYIIAGVVHKKIVFKSRPRPVTGEASTL